MGRNAEVAIIGGGPAGLSAAVELGEVQSNCILMDDHSQVGGQLNKQIHKFFGSEKHSAGQRGIDIAKKLEERVSLLNIEIWPESTVLDFDNEGCLWVNKGDSGIVDLMADRVIIATGANENTFPFQNWTLPGIMGAGALQTMMNLYRVLPGRRVLMVGAGNVGLIVAYQLLQAGAEVIAIIESANKISGYDVHRRKILRTGVPILTSTSIVSALGEKEVEGAVISSVDDEFRPLPGTERQLAVDTICLAVGLSPLIDLAWSRGCKIVNEPLLGGWIPVHDADQQTNIDSVYIVGDCCSIEEASVAMEEGRIAGISVAESMNLLDYKTAMEKKNVAKKVLHELRSGPLGATVRTAKERLSKSTTFYRQNFFHPTRYEKCLSNWR